MSGWRWWAPPERARTTIARLMIRAYDATGGAGAGGRRGRARVVISARCAVRRASAAGGVSLRGQHPREPRAGRRRRGCRERSWRGRSNARRPRLRGLPAEGLDAELRERGVNLSHGQRQLWPSPAPIYNPRVLALDEATSSVDPESEALIRAAMLELLDGRASLIIAHRLSTIQNADRILVLHKGGMRESGKHAALLAAGGIYARLYELQFGRETA